MHRLFHEIPLEVGQEILLTDAKAHYLINVLRAVRAEKIIIFNNTGYEFLAELLVIKKMQVSAQIIAKTFVQAKKDRVLHLAQGIAKSQKMDWIIQKAVELGVSDITPLLLDYSQIKQDQAILAKKQQHWRQIAISASEQSARVYVPNLHCPIDLAEFLAASCKATLIALDPAAERKFDPSLVDQNALVLFIGAEGGFSAGEKTLLKQANACFVSLGKQILRAETASVASLAIIQFLHPAE